MKVKEFLNRGNWIKGHSARDRWGKPCGSREPQACSWDVLGAINFCYDEPMDRLLAMDIIVNHLPIGNKLICFWNDATIWEEVESVLEKADV